MKKRPGTWVLSLLLLLLLCCVSAEEQQANLESNKETLSVSSIIEDQTESKLENEDKFKTDENNDVDYHEDAHKHNHVQDGHLDHVDAHNHIDNGEDQYHHEEVEEFALERDDLNTAKKVVHNWETPSKVPPHWDPLLSIGKPPPTRPPYRVSYTPYTTPTTLPNRPDWKKSDWLNYFKTNHSNFWFVNELKKNYSKEHGIQAEEDGVSVDQEKTGSYFPGFPAYSIVPGPDRHRVSYRSGPGHKSVISSPFLYNNKVNLKSENKGKKKPIIKDSNNETNLVISLYQKLLDGSSLNLKQIPESLESSHIPILKRKKRSGQKSEDERLLFFLKNRPQSEEDLGDELGNIQKASLNKVPNLYLNMEAQNPPEFVTPSKLLIKQSNLGPQITGMGESYQASRFQNLPSTGNNQEDDRSEQLLKQQQEYFMFQLKQQQLQQQQQQQQFLQQAAFTPQYPPPYWFNPYLYPPYNFYQQQQPSGGASTSTSCSSSGCTSAAAAGSSTSTSTSSGGPSASKRQSPARRRNGQRRTTTEAPALSTTTRRSTTTRTTTTTSTTTTTQASNGGLNLNSRPNFNQNVNNTATSDTTTDSTTTTTTRAPFSIRFGKRKREAHREDDEDEVEPYYDYDIPTSQDGYKYHRPDEPFEPPQHEFEHQLEQMLTPEAIQPLQAAVQPLPTTIPTPFEPSPNNFTPQRPNQIIQETLKPIQEPWQPQEPYHQIHDPNHQPQEPYNQPQESYKQHHGVQQPSQTAQPYPVRHQQQPKKPYPHPNKPPPSKSFMQTLKEHLQPSKSFQKSNNPIKPSKPYPSPPVTEIYPPLQGTEPTKDALGEDDDYTQSEEPLHLTPDTEAPSSLQTILSSHQIKTNFLKTPPRTEHFGYQSIEYQPKIYQPSNMMTMLTPKKEVEHYPSHYQEIAERFYTTSGESKIGPSLGHGARPLSYAQDDADDRHDVEEDMGQSKVDDDDGAEGKENPLVNTAVIALKLSSKILDLYKTVSPYLPQ